MTDQARIPDGGVTEAPEARPIIVMLTRPQLLSLYFASRHGQEHFREIYGKNHQRDSLDAGVETCRRTLVGAKCL